jgi:FAD/FMN-containing dehydrogenase
MQHKLIVEARGIRRLKTRQVPKMTPVASLDKVEDSMALSSALAAIVGPDHVTSDEAECVVFSQDIFSRAPFVAKAVVAPSTLEELAGVVRAATASGHAVFPRGGGVSYSGGYLVSVPKAVIVDLRRMNSIIEINTVDMYVRVQPGVTWTALDAALQAHEVRTPFWGVQSGRVSTIGGAMSQHASYYGSGLYGVSAESVQSLAVVLADGRTLRTGSAAIEGVAPFSRFFGPDLSGIFLGDNGALGIKGEITLKLIARPRHEDFLSASFPDFEQAAAAMAAIARLGVVADGFLMDPGLAAARLKRVSIAQDLGALGGVVKNSTKTSGSLAKGLMSAAKVAVAGRDLMDASSYSIHLSIEHRYRAAVDEAIREVASICIVNGGRILENSIPKIVRGNPFGPLNIVIGPDGKRWLPTHGIVPLSKAPALQAALRAVFNARADALVGHGIEWVLLACTIGTGAFLVEPVITWPDEMFPFHERLLDPSYRDRLKPLPHNPEAFALVSTVRDELKKVYAAHGATHMQLGRAYAFSARIAPPNRDLLSSLKANLDPNNLMNPGALQLADAATK